MRRELQPKYKELFAAAGLVDEKRMDTGRPLIYVGKIG